MAANYKIFLRKCLKVSVLSLILAFFAKPVFASGGEGGDFNPGEVIMHHIADSHEWHLATIGESHISIPLPIILYSEKGLAVFMSSAFHTPDSTYQGYKMDAHGHINFVNEDGTIATTTDEAGNVTPLAPMDFSITKNVASMFLSVILMFFVFSRVSSYYKNNHGKAPKGIASFFEPIIIYIRDDIAKAAIGEKSYKKFLPYLLTVFFFIWFNNLLGLLPGGANVTGNIAVTLVLAVITFIITTINGNSTYWGHIFMPPVPVALYIIMIPVEIIGIFTKPFSLMIRLFANITAGHIIILSLLGLIFLFQNAGISIAAVPFAVAMNFLELFVALLQAYVFTLLSAMYFATAVEEHHHDHKHEEAHH